MKLGFGRVIPAPASSEADGATSERTGLRRPALSRVEPPVVVAASDRARELLARAETEAAAVIARAEAQASALAEELRARARADAAIELTAREAALAARETHALERQQEQLVALARLLAERLLGEALALDPERVVALARQALTEARGARRITLVAHPDDARLLERALATGTLPPPADVVADPARRRGQLRLDTDLGTLDADLGPQLDRLAQKLAEVLRHA